MSNEWFSRPVLFVADIDRPVDFYLKQAWRYEEEGELPRSWSGWVMVARRRLAQRHRRAETA